MKKIILCPIEEGLKNAPGHLYFGSNLFEEEAKKMGKEIEVKLLYYRQKKFSAYRTLILNIILAARIICTRHDVLYYGTDPVNLFLLSLMKDLGVYRKKMYAWKYTKIESDGSKIKALFKRLLYNPFTRIFMITESYVDDSIRAGIVRNGLLKYMRWGEDLDYVDKFKTTRDEVFTFITTGKAYRDYDTVCAAFEKVNSARLKVFTANGWGGYDYKAILDKYRNPNIEVYYTNGMSGNVMDYLYSEMQKSHCALVICQKVKFGVGYTQVLDSMACSLPVIATFNPGNPIDIDKEGVGCTVPACDLEALAKAMQRMVDDAEWHNSCSKAARKLVEKDYNLRNMSRDIVEMIFSD